MLLRISVVQEEHYNVKNSGQEEHIRLSTPVVL